MAVLKVNTDVVFGAAERIKGYNNQMRDDFPNVQTAVTQLDNSWDGSAAAIAISKFNELKNNFCDARYNVLNNFVNFLIMQVDEGYVQTEDTNISLASQFK